MKISMNSNLSLFTKHLVAICFGCLLSSASFAGIAFQTLYGTGTGDLSSFDADNVLTRSKFKTDKMTVETHLDPIKSLPLTVGLFYSTFNAEPEIPTNVVQGIKGFDYGWDVLTWTEVKGFGVLFRYGQALGGQYQITRALENGELESSTYQVKNSFVGLGIATPLTSTFGVLLEYRQRVESSFDTNSVDSTGQPFGFDGGMILLGLEISA